MQEKSAHVAQRPIMLQGSAGPVMTVAHHIPGYSVKNSTLDYAKWVSVGRKAKAAQTGILDADSGALSIVHSLEGSLHPSRIGNRRIGKKQYWSMASQSEREFLTELHGYFNIRFLYGTDST